MCKNVKSLYFPIACPSARACVLSIPTLIEFRIFQHRAPKRISELVKDRNPPKGGPLRPEGVKAQQCPAAVCNCGGADIFKRNKNS